MNRFRVKVEYADGDNWAGRRFTSEVEVEAENALQARLLGEQMAYTPQPGKPGHIQITRTVVSARDSCREIAFTRPR